MCCTLLSIVLHTAQHQQCVLWEVCGVALFGQEGRQHTTPPSRLLFVQRGSEWCCREPASAVLCLGGLGVMTQLQDGRDSKRCCAALRPTRGCVWGGACGGVRGREGGRCNMQLRPGRAPAAGVGAVSATASLATGAAAALAAISAAAAGVLVLCQQHSPP